MLAGWALANARRARGQENVLGGVVEFVALLVSVVRHVFINLARHARTGVVSSARTSARRSAKEGASDAPHAPYCTLLEGWTTKSVFGRLGRLQTETSPGGGISLDSLPATLPYSPQCRNVPCGVRDRPRSVFLKI